MRNLQGLFWFIIIMCFAWMQSCQSSDLAKMEVVKQESQPDEVSRDVTLRYSDSGIIKRILTAPLVHKYTTDTLYTLFPEGLKAQFFNKQGDMVTELTCGYAITTNENKDDGELVFRDNVRIKNHKNETLISDEIYLKDSIIQSDSTVYIVTPTITLRGTSLTAPRDFSSYKLTNPVGVARAEAFNKKGEKN